MYIYLYVHIYIYMQKKGISFWHLFCFCTMFSPFSAVFEHSGAADEVGKKGFVKDPSRQLKQWV